jgi:hypothetical protein
MSTITPRIRSVSTSATAPAASIAPVDSMGSSPSRPGLSVHIDHLALKGFSTRDGQRVAHSLQQEFTRLIATHGLAHAGLSSREGREALSAPAVRTASRAEITGARLAQSLFRTLSR